MSQGKNSQREITLHRRRILVDGKPHLVLAGEIHYFRVKSQDWADRLDKLQANGLDTVASYIPWIWHELPDGTFDLDGRSHEQRNLIAFIDMCAERGLNFIARPGPFNMAELKNEGIPYRVYADHPHLHPTSWNGAEVLTRTLDYLHPEYEASWRQWYAHVMPVLAKRLATRGGPIIAVQLDNEIGMLSWVSNSPDLTDFVCEDMRAWAKARYGDAQASQRVSADVHDSAAWAAALRKPDNASLPLHHDIGLYNRNRNARYIRTLRDAAREHGIVGVPLLINIAGDGIGMSQLHEGYRGEPQMTSGTDLYLGELTVSNAPALYASNAFMAALHDRDQPATSLEFEAGNSNYGDDLGVLTSPNAIQLKTRLCVAQGLRMLNYYLHAGGENPPIPSVGDGTDRLAFTGQRHGFAAPVGPEGQLNATYFGLTRAVESVRPLAEILADSDEEHDALALGLVVDHYLSEYKFVGSEQRQAQVADLERFRGLGPRNILVRALLFNGYSFPAVDLQASVPTARCVVLPTGRTLSKLVQQNLATYVLSGGKLLLVGLLPDQDHDGTTCTVLADALGLRDAGRVFDSGAPNFYWPSVVCHGSLAPRPEVRTSYVQKLVAADGGNLKPLLTEVASGAIVGAHVKAGRGEAFMLGCDYPADLDFYRALMRRLKVSPRWQLDADTPGVMVTSTISPKGDRLLHLINLAPHPASVKLNYRGREKFSGRSIHMDASSGLILPMGVRAKGYVISSSTAEIVKLGADELVVRPTQRDDVIVLKTKRKVSCEVGLVFQQGQTFTVILSNNLHQNKKVTITLR